MAHPSPLGARHLAAVAVSCALAACAGEKLPPSTLAPPELLVEVLPRHALLELDGVGHGRGSRTLPAPPPGEHVLVVSAPGFEPQERSLPRGSLDGVRVGVALAPEGLARAQALDLDEPVGLVKAAAALGRAGLHRDALDYATRAVALDGRLPAAQRALGDALADLRRRDEARAAWGRYLLLAPDAPDAAAVARRMEEGRTTFEMGPGR